MKALNLYDERDIRFEEIPDPIIEKADDVIIKVKATGICGSDISRFKKLGPYVEGMTFGHEFSGEVTDIGSGAANVSIGERVSGCPTFHCGHCIPCQKGELSRCKNLTIIGARRPGAYAEYVKLPAAHVLPLPENVDYTAAALVEPSAVVAHGFYRTSMQPGAEVAVVGCGSIGLLAVQWARIFGAEKVYAVDIDESKLEVAKKVGADVLINAKESPAHVQIQEHTDGCGVDVAVESAGSPASSAQILALPKKGGEVVLMGIPYADITIERFYFERIVRNELRVLGSWNALSSPFPGQEWHASLHYMNTGQINVKPMISHRLPLEEGPKTFENIINQREKFVKVMFSPEKKNNQ
ncbi:galactitol-1-phosphate 5-dehydrogenase [Alteribacillus sp. HJP-4]|uniref:galactitol-1-phosphate 5-dehydrogenase n=1 Tax=Alteribacillus sp. HJP-4 TaxID=2775394 RepID=UPI0035CCF57C